MKVAIVHDYLTQTGGAERVVLYMLRAFPDAPLYTSLYAPELTFPEFADADVRPMGHLNWSGVLRRHQRIGLPLYGRAFRSLNVDADVVICSSSGWAHQVSTPGHKIVYCYAPARWLYEPAALFAGTPRPHERLVGLLGPMLRSRDAAAAASADLYLTTSTLIRRRIKEVYDIDALVMPPPPALPAEGPVDPLDLDAGALLTVGRLFAYKNMEVVVRAARESGRRLWVVGEGPDRRRLEKLGGTDVSFLGRVTDAQLRWLYQHCRALVAAAYEDFGLTPLEANAFGRPVAALRWGGYLDTVVEGETGVFFDRPDSGDLNRALDRIDAGGWNPDRLRAHAAGFGEERFINRLREVAATSVGPSPVS